MQRCKESTWKLCGPTVSKRMVEHQFEIGENNLPVPFTGKFASHSPVRVSSQQNTGTLKPTILTNSLIRKQVLSTFTHTYLFLSMKTSTNSGTCRYAHSQKKLHQIRVILQHSSGSCLLCKGMEIMTRFNRTVKLWERK